jgi:hypothetical protein
MSDMNRITVPRFLRTDLATYSLWVLGWFGVLTIFMALAGCQAAGGATAQAVLEAAQSAAADGVITPDEQAALKQLVSPGVDWMASLGLIGGSVLSALLGVKILPTRVLQGPFDPKPSQPSA